MIVAYLFGVSYLQQLLPGEWRQGTNLTSPPTVDTVFFFSFSENTSTMLPPIGSIAQVFTAPTLTQMNIRSQYCVSTTSQALRIRQLEKACGKIYNSFSPAEQNAPKVQTENPKDLEKWHG